MNPGRLLNELATGLLQDTTNRKTNNSCLVDSGIHSPVLVRSQTLESKEYDEATITTTQCYLDMTLIPFTTRLPSFSEVDTAKTFNRCQQKIRLGSAVQTQWNFL